MRIAFICPPISGRGGMETAIRNLVAGLQKLGDEIQIFGLGESFLDPTWHQDLPWTQIGDATGNQVKQLLSFSLGVSRYLRSYKPDVVIAPTAPSILIARLASLLSGRRLPVASWLHFSLKAVGWKPLLPLADCQIAISEGVAKELQTCLGPKHKIFTLHNGTTLDTEPIPRPPSDAPVKFVYVGRMFVDGQKRVNDILQAASELRGDFCMTFVGAGDDLQDLQNMARDLGLSDRVTWAGWQSEPWQAVGKAHTLILSSSFEGFGMVLVEAMSRGLPCISSDCEVGPSDIITHGHNGWLFPVADIDALRSRMQAIIDDRSILPHPDVVRASVRKFGLDETSRLFQAALHSIQGSTRAGGSVMSTSELQDVG